jgi:eukaryotic-like serine/threonine-protein kinase
MSISSGTRLGPYEILAPIGAGGMGEVYRARDSRLERDVAIKVLPLDFSRDAERARRFEQEARAVAALNHPNILAIHDIGSHDGGPYIVSELLDGQTVREPLVDGPLPVRKAVEYARQIALGLAAAHGKEIVHRDLKPENIFITSDGRVKILDFGLAKVTLDESLSQGPTVATSPGAVMGTVGYMSPEQVRGSKLDHRSDLFSFGAVLYEMLTGRRAFQRDTAAETMTAILKEDPPEMAVSGIAVSPGLDRIIRHCLEKNPEERFQSARDIAFALDALTGSSIPASSILSTTAVVPVPRRRRWIQAIGILAIIVAAFAIGIAVDRTRVKNAAFADVRFETLTFEPQTIFNARFMPDGQTIVYSSALRGNEPRLYALRSDSVVPQFVSDPGTHLLSISSKGELAVLTGATFFNHRLFNGTLARMTLGGAPRAWMEQVREADWSPDGSTLAIIRNLGDKDTLEYPPGTVLVESADYLSDPRVSPDGSRVAFFQHVGRMDDRGWVKVVDRSKQAITLAGEFQAQEGLAWTRDGRTILFGAADVPNESGFQLFSVPLSGGASLAIHTPGDLIVHDTTSDGRMLVAREDIKLGMVIKLPDWSSERDLSWLDLDLNSFLSNDGRTLLFTDASGDAGLTYAVSLRKTDGSPAVRLGAGSALSLSPDGKWAAAEIVGKPQLILYPVGAGEPRQLDVPIAPRSAMWFPDSQNVLVCGSSGSTPVRCYQQAITGGSARAATPEGVNGVVTPDGKRILGCDKKAVCYLYPLDGSTPVLSHGVGPDDQFAGWSADAGSILVRPGNSIPARLEKIDIASGKRTFVRELAPEERSGLLHMDVGNVIADGRGYTYGYWKQNSRLIVAKGAH